MRFGIMLGVILGVLLTVGSAYTYDTVSGRTATTSTATAGDQRPMVNWDVVSKDLGDLRAGLADLGTRVQDGLRRLTT